MRTKNVFLIVAGIINLFTAVLHTIEGQVSLVNPLLNSNVALLVKTELVAVWHMATIILFASSVALLHRGLAIQGASRSPLILFIGTLYVLFALSFIIASVVYTEAALQWTLLLPIGIFCFVGERKAGH